jgi:NAD(P)-dependent dehydrogenase (short-subunit alcohol dehydrogenase family)
MNLKGKVAIVTGAGSGNGRAISLRFAQEGIRTALADIDVTGLEKTARDIEVLGMETLTVAVDMSVETQVADMVSIATRKLGRLDILVNNAGILGPMSKPIVELAEQDWSATLGVNLLGPWLGMKYAIPHMTKAGRGCIINIASTAGLRAIVGAAPYCASKAALIMLTKVVAAEYAARGIRVNAICPGSINTPMMDRVISDMSSHGIRDARANVESGNLFKRLGEPDEVAAAAAFLASEDDSSFVTGGFVLVDGGFMCL